MYTPPKFNDSTVEEVELFLKKNSFGILVNQTKGKLWGTHIPLELSENELGKPTLVGHISRGNRQWKGFQEKEEVLAIFQGPHAYVSSTWYDHENVPTWNYVAVHVYGKVKILEGNQLYQALKRLMEKYESMTQTHLKIEDLSEKYVQREMKGIVGFEIEITDIQANYKLSQNRNDESYNSVVKHLHESKNPNDKEISRLMKERRKEK